MNMKSRAVFAAAVAVFTVVLAQLFTAIGDSSLVQSLFEPAQEPVITEVKKPGFDEDTSAVLAAADKLYYPVVRVVDGDTLIVDMDGEDVGIRLIGIDSPETKAPGQPVECFGYEATARMQQLAEGQSVLLIPDSSQQDVDRFGRLLRYVYLPDNTFLNEVMVQEGYAYEYTYDEPYLFQQEFLQLQDTAEENERGLWSPYACGEI